ncbi:MAG: hypothetical protein EOO61_07225 [Hymenobacter sp.]|nr:MAG: hypothetical protein EOO61_07225 [Hymenobacter sp.]
MIPYLDANSEPLKSGSLAIELSDLGFGRIWRIQEEGEVLFRVTGNKMPVVLSAGKNKTLRKISMPEVADFDFNKWHSTFSKIGIWMWLEHPKEAPANILLTAVWDKYRILEYRLSDDYSQAEGRRGAELLDWWLKLCFERVERWLFDNKPSQQNRTWR